MDLQIVSRREPRDPVSAEQRQAAAVRVLVRLSPATAHDQGCPRGVNTVAVCNCFVIQYVRIQAKALDEAGLLCALSDGDDAP